MNVKVNVVRKAFMGVINNFTNTISAFPQTKLDVLMQIIHLMADSSEMQIAPQCQ